MLINRFFKRKKMANQSNKLMLRCPLLVVFLRYEQEKNQQNIIILIYLRINTSISLGHYWPEKNWRYLFWNKTVNEVLCYQHLKSCHTLIFLFCPHWFNWKNIDKNWNFTHFLAYLAMFELFIAFPYVCFTECFQQPVWKDF